MSRLTFLNGFRYWFAQLRKNRHFFHFGISILFLVVMCPHMQRLKPRSDQEENELVIFHLRQLCDAKQKAHVHIGEVGISVIFAQVNEPHAC